MADLDLTDIYTQLHEEQAERLPPSTPRLTIAISVAIGLIMENQRLQQEVELLQTALEALRSNRH